LEPAPCCWVRCWPRCCVDTSGEIGNATCHTEVSLVSEGECDRPKCDKPVSGEDGAADPFSNEGGLVDSIDFDGHRPGLIDGVALDGDCNG